MTPRRNMPKLCRSLMFPVKLHTMPVTHGLAHEQDALAEFHKVTGLKVEKCGLFISQDHPFLAATPDGLVGEEYIVEVKCPYKGRFSSIEPGEFFPFLVYVEGNVTLKKNHKYYDQVQCQMGVTKRPKCYFVVYTFCDLKIFEIMFDSEFYSLSLVPKVTSFFDQYYRQYIAEHI